MNRSMMKRIVTVIIMTVCLVVSFGSFSMAASKVDMSKAKITLNGTTFTYTGKALQPTVTVKYGNKTLKKGTDYTVSYSNNTNVGTAKVTVKGKGNYTGSVNKSYTIIPQNIKGKWLVCGQIDTDGSKIVRRVYVKWNAQKVQTTGYQIQLYNISTKKTTTVAVEPNTKTSTTINANAKTKYKVRIRTYKTVKGKTYFSEWKDWLEVKTL